VVDGETQVRRKWRLLKATMDERARRLWAGAEAEAMGWGGIARVARATGLAISTVTLGRTEVRGGAHVDDVVKVRRKGGGRRRHEVVHPDLAPLLEALVAPATRGDPESALRWTNKSTHALSAEMFSSFGIRVGDKTVARLLRKSGYSLQAPSKTVEGKQHPDRNAQLSTSTRRQWTASSAHSLHLRRHQEEGTGRQLQERRQRMASSGRARTRRRS
jgi:hypothetical protein